MLFVTKSKYKKLEERLNYINSKYLEQQKKDADLIKELKGNIYILSNLNEDLQKNNIILENSLKDNYTTVNLVMERNQELKKQLESYQVKT